MPEKAGKYEDIAPLQGALGAKIGWNYIEGPKGRGLFALEDIPAGTMIINDPVVPLSTESIPNNGDAPDGYLLDWLPDTPGQEHALILGYLILSNHSDEPNIHVECDYGNICACATTMRDIKAGEELTWNYACPIWFDKA